jgi:hypothetical protein
MVVLIGIKHWQISQVFFCVYLSQLSQIAKRSEVTARGATVGSSSNRLAVSLMDAANDRRQQSGASSVILIPICVKAPQVCQYYTVLNRAVNRR